MRAKSDRVFIDQLTRSHFMTKQDKKKHGHKSLLKGFVKRFFSSL